MKTELQQRPLVVATVTRESDLSYLASRPSLSADVLEFRIDDLSPVLEEALSALEDAALPVLGTVRSPGEGGANRLSPDQRRSLYDRILPSCDLIDVEVMTLREPSFDGLISSAGRKGVLTVASFHDFDRFPGLESIANRVEEAAARAADIVKIAVRLEDREDLFGLARLVAETRSRGQLISAMGMGPLGRLSRLVLAEAGSCLNYGYLNTPNAPGQWAAAELVSLLRELRAD